MINNSNNILPILDIEISNTAILRDSLINFGHSYLIFKDNIRLSIMYFIIYG